MKSNRSTVISVLPFPTSVETKPGLFPGRYQIEAAPKNSIALLVIENAVKKFDRFDGMDPIQTIELSETVAKSFVEDYCGAQLGADGTGGPGLTWFPNEEFHHGPLETVEQVETYKQHAIRQCVAEKKEEIGRLRVRQINWFKNLVKAADDEWTKYHRYTSISDLMRLAAVETGQTAREWLSIDIIEELTECPMCLSKVSKRAIMCKTCGTVQPGREEEAKKFLIVRPPQPLQATAK